MASCELCSCSSCSPSQRHRKDVRAAPVNFQPAPVQSLIPNAVLPPAPASASVTLDTSRSRTSRAVSIQLAAYRCIALLTVNCRYNYTSRNIYVFVGDQQYPRFCGRSEISTFLWEIRNIHVVVGDQKYPRFCGRSEMSTLLWEIRAFSHRQYMAIFLRNGRSRYFECSYHTPLSPSLSRCLCLSVCLCLSLSLSPSLPPLSFFPRSLSAHLTNSLLKQP